MRTKPVREVRHRRSPLKPRNWIDSRVIVMDARGRVLRRVEPSDFAKRGEQQDDES